MAARSIWKGDLSVGLVSVPVAAYVATDAGKSTGTNWLHKACNHPINQKKTCATCNAADIPMSDIVNGVKQADGSYVILSKDELAGIKVKSSSTIAVDAFVPADDVDPLYVESTYYLTPTKATPGFALLREAMVAQDVMLVGKVCLHGREQHVAIRPYGKLLMLQLLRTADEVRDVIGLPGSADADLPVDAQQLALANQLVEMYRGEFNPAAFEDTYATAFAALVEAKRTGAVLPAATEAPAAPVVDFMAALKASLAAAPAKAAAPVAVPAPVKAAKRGKKVAA